jgi:hypothetical protein
MPEWSNNFQLALELSNVFPVGEVVHEVGGAVYSKILSLARDIRRSGSDLLVEEDLAAIFGRARVDTELERRFRRDVVRNATIVTFHEGCRIVLDPGTGPTLNRALTLKDHGYLSTIIQISYLGWVHGRSSLAAALVECMNKRFELNVHGATSDPMRVLLQH